MKDLHEIREMLMDELVNTADSGTLTVDKVKIVDMLTHSIKSIDTIEAMHNSGYSGNNRYYYHDGYEYKPDYGRSYGRRTDGRYSRTSDSMMEHLDRMMDDAKTDKERDAIRSFMEQMKRM